MTRLRGTPIQSAESSRKTDSWPFPTTSVSGDLWAESACRDADPTLFDLHRVKARQRAAAAYCAKCSVAEECLAFGIEMGSEGIFGGTLIKRGRVISPIQLPTPKPAESRTKRTPPDPDALRQHVRRRSSPMCTVEDCGEPAKVKGLCSPHYQREWARLNPGLTAKYKREYRRRQRQRRAAQ